VSDRQRPLDRYPGRLGLVLGLLPRLGLRLNLPPGLCLLGLESDIAAGPSL